MCDVTRAAGNHNCTPNISLLLSDGIVVLDFGVLIFLHITCSDQ